MDGVVKPVKEAGDGNEEGWTETQQVVEDLSGIALKGQSFL
jgi:hypothetical protein